MTNRAETDIEIIRGIVQAIEAHWRAQEYERIGDLVAEDVVIAPPGSDERLRGREAYVQSFRDYDQWATTLEFSSAEPQIDVVGEVAVAVSAFRVVYEHQGATHREKGNDILVLERQAGRWLVVWRTMQVEPAAEEED